MTEPSIEPSTVPANPVLTNLWSPDDAFVVDALRTAEITSLRMIYNSSNSVFLATLAHPEHGEGLGVYKPATGEAPLSDFPYGTIHRREVAAYEFSRLLGWDVVPPTVLREGPHGEGSMQLFIEHDPRAHYFVLREQQQFEQALMRIAAFDLVANNADRKGGHVLLAGERLWCIDNALCFHRHEKLRTVIWDFAGRELPDAWVDDLRRVSDCLARGDEPAAPLLEHVSPAEVVALVQRSAELASHPVLPEMYPWRCVPWPLV